jgi:hypothetical protein
LVIINREEKQRKKLRKEHKREGKERREPIEEEEVEGRIKSLYRTKRRV